jgi:hypothetical protein
MFRRICSFLMAWLLMLAAPGGFAQPQGTEQQLKAAFLVNFMKYVEWPDNPAKATICLFGRDVLSAALAGYEGRTVGGRELVVRRISSHDQLGECQLVFVPDIEEARIAAILRWTEGLPILTVSDAEFFARQGGGIALVREDARLRFDVNLDALQRARLKAASPMLRLARQVSGGAR